MAKSAENIAPKPAEKVRRRRAKTSRDTISRAEISSAPEYYSKAIGRALDILEYFSDAETTLSLTEIGRLSRIPEASLFRILLTLEHHSYLQQNADGSYS